MATQKNLPSGESAQLITLDQVAIPGTAAEIATEAAGFITNSVELANRGRLRHNTDTDAIVEFRNDPVSGWGYYAEGGLDNNGNVRVVAENPMDYSGTTTAFENTDVTDTETAPAAQPSSGARVVTIAFLDKGSAVATELYVVFNADDATDAAAKLAAAASRHVVLLDERRNWTFPAGAECTRIDFKSDDAAPVGGSNKVAGEYVI